MKKIIVILQILIMIGLAVGAYAEDISFEMTVDKKKLRLGETIALSLTFKGTQNISVTKDLEIKGFQVWYVGPSKMTSIINGQVSSSVIHSYTLIPLETGKFQIGPFSIAYKGETYTSDATVVEVVADAPRAKGQPQGAQITKDGLLDRIFLVMEMDKNEIYINEVFELRIKLYVNNIETNVGRGIPEFNHEGFIVNEVKEAKQYTDIIDGLSYQVVEYALRLFSTRSGDFTLGPARKTVYLRTKTRRRRSFFDDFFEDNMLGSVFGYETHPLEIKSVELPVKVSLLPRQGKPERFKGAVGNFSLDVSANPREVNVGDPITLKITVRGQGNFNTVTIPQLTSKRGFKTYEPQVVEQGNGIKTFEQVIIPKKADIHAVPALTLSFFDTNKGLYRTMKKGPFPIVVKRQEKEEEVRILESPGEDSGMRRKEILGRDIIFLKEAPGVLFRKGEYLYKKKIFMVFQLIPLVLLLSVFLIRREKNKLRSDMKYARKIRASKKARDGIRKIQGHLTLNNPSGFYDTVFKVMQGYLGDKFHLPTGSITVDVAEHILKEKNCEKAIIDGVKDIFSQCDMARYAPSQLNRSGMEKTFEKVREVIEGLEKFRA